MNTKFIALYLPQYHPIRENDEWWGRGFTEWTNVTKAKPLFKGHHQPDLPSDLGFYDLRVAETRRDQAALARQYGISGFCYYHYWFGNGKRLLEKPLNEVIRLQEPDFPFMICWANQSWTGVWHGLDRKVLTEQTYPGPADDERHFEELLPILSDRRYIQVDQKPVFMVYAHRDLPNPKEWSDRWRRIAQKHGFKDLYLICEDHRVDWNCKEIGFDAYVNKPAFQRRPAWTSWNRPYQKIKNKVLDALNRPTVLEAQDLIEYFVPTDKNDRAIPCVLPNWDNTPRSGARGYVLNNPTPEVFARQIERAVERSELRNAEEKFIFIKSWNEWAEGNYLEPSRRWGHSYLEVVSKFSRTSP